MVGSLLRFYLYVHVFIASSLLMHAPVALPMRAC